MGSNPTLSEELSWLTVLMAVYCKLRQDRNVATVASQPERKMSHIVLARKYRPKSFKEVIGQDNSVSILESFISNNSIPHSLIFCGGRGVGKTSMARIFAKAISSDDISKNPLLAEDIDNGKSLDVIEIDAASNNGVEQVRELIESSQYSSLNCCLLYTSPSPRDRQKSRMPSSA